MRDWFVGALFAIAACLYLYKGFTPKENRLLNLAAVFAVGVAIFPMNWPPKNWPPPGWPNEPICNTFTAGYVHGTCAVLCNGPVKLDTKMLFESVSHNDRSDH
jgi:hypothetical protein